MYEELLAELTAMNGNAKALLEKYNNAGVKLDDKTNELLQLIADAGISGLEAINTLLANGNVAQAENALKLEGKTKIEVSFNFKPFHIALVSNINTSDDNARYEADLTNYINSETKAIAINLSRNMSHNGDYHSYLSGNIYQEGNENKTYFHNKTFQNYANHFDSFMIVPIDPNGSKKLKIDILSAFNDNSSSGQTIELKGVIS